MSVNVGGKQIKRSEQEVKEERKEEVKINPADYSCEIIQEKTTFDKSNDRKLPSDAFNVFYVVDGEEHLDVTRSAKMVNIFDMYYDRYGKDCVQKIDYGHGTINPGMWKYKSPTKRVKKRK